MQTEHEGCQDKINLVEVQLRSYEEEVERLRTQVATVKWRELDSRTEVANMKRAFETSGAKAVKAYKSSQEFVIEKRVLFDKAVKCLLSCIQEEHPEWDLTFVNPDVVPDLIVEFAKENKLEEVEMVAQEQRTRGDSSNEQPDTTQVAGDNVGSVQPDDDVSP